MATVRVKVPSFVISTCYGGFGVSAAVVRRMRELGSKSAADFVLKGEKYPNGEVERFEYGWSSVDRADPLLVEAVRELGDKANGHCAELRIIDSLWVEVEIDEYDGKESMRGSTAHLEHCE